MKLYLQTLSRHQVSQQEQADFYRFMLEDLDRLDRLINQLLDAGRLDAGAAGQRSGGRAAGRRCCRIAPRRSASAIACRPRRSGCDLQPCTWSRRGGSIWTSSFAT